jgi:hypothetical protein
MKLLLAASMMAAGMLAAMPPATAHGVNHRHRIVHIARHAPDTYMCRAYPAYGYVGSYGEGAYAGYRGYPLFGIYPSYACAGDYNAF